MRHGGFDARTFVRRYNQIKIRVILVQHMNRIRTAHRYQKRGERDSHRGYFIP